jgi:hypothetical protein
VPIEDDCLEEGNAPFCAEPEKPFTVLVTGGRDYTDRATVFRALNALYRKHPNLIVLHGACPTGADALAQEWAVANERPYIGIPAEWSRFGPSAGPRRNAILIHYLPDGAVAFPGGLGTADCVKQATAAGLTVWHPAKAGRG